MEEQTKPTSPEEEAKVPEAPESPAEDGRPPEAGEAKKSAESESPVDYAQIAREDLAALKKEFPHLAALNDVSELDAPMRYAELRDLGLSAREAYLATSRYPGDPRGAAVRAMDSRSHLKSAVPRAAVAGGADINGDDLRSARELFSELPDGEIRRLYRRVTAQNN